MITREANCSIKRLDGVANAFYTVSDDSGNLIDDVLGYNLGRETESLTIFTVGDAEFSTEQTRTLTVNGVEYPIDTVTIEYA